MPLRAIAKKLFPRIPAPEAVAGLASVLVGVLLLFIKFFAYFLTGSAAIFSDAMESIVNVLASVFAVYALFYAHRPADEEHPYGHGKVEFLSAGFEGGMIFVAALVIAFRAVEALIKPADILKIEWGLVLMLVAMVVNGALGLYLVRSGHKHNSLTLEADGKHLITDAVTSAATFIALLLVWLTKLPILDPIAALLIAVYISLTAYQLMRRSAAGLLDEQDKEDEKLLRQILDSHLAPAGKLPHICSYHKLRHRHSGRYHWVDFHMVVPPTLTVDQGHEMASAIEFEIEQAIVVGNATAHIEPCKGECCNKATGRVE